MDYKLIALDIDGTLLNSKSELTRSTKQAIREAVAAGLKVCLVSGRRPRGMAAYAREIGLEHPLVGFNGGIVADPVSLLSLQSCTMPRAYLSQVLEHWQEAGIASFAYCDSLPLPDIYYSQEPSWPDMADYVLQEHDNIRRLSSLSRDLPYDPVRLMVGDSEENTVRAQDIALPLLNPEHHKTFFTKHYNGTWYFEIYPLQATKANGLRFLCQHFSITPDQIVAVGDHINDLDMIEYAGLGVAMGNAQGIVKEVANLTIGHHDEDGLAVFLRTLISKKQKT